MKILLHAQSENQPLTGLQCDDVISGYTAANQWSPLTSLRCDVRACCMPGPGWQSACSCHQRRTCYAALLVQTNAMTSLGSSSTPGRLGLAGSQRVAVISVGRVMLLCWSRIRAQPPLSRARPLRGL